MSKFIFRGNRKTTSNVAALNNLNIQEKEVKEKLVNDEVCHQYYGIAILNNLGADPDEKSATRNNIQIALQTADIIGFCFDFNFWAIGSNKDTNVKEVERKVKLALQDVEGIEGDINIVVSEIQTKFISTDQGLLSYPNVCVDGEVTSRFKGLLDSVEETTNDTNKIAIIIYKLSTSVNVNGEKRKSIKWLSDLEEPDAEELGGKCDPKKGCHWRSCTCGAWCECKTKVPVVKGS
jgi:hypothetical protein